MTVTPTISIPALVRIKSGALAKLGTYCRRYGFTRVTVVVSSDLPDTILDTARRSLEDADIDSKWLECRDTSFETAQRLFIDLARDTTALIGIGGGRALDVAKYLAFLAHIPNVAVPTSLSNDGFCSPGASLTVEGRRRSLSAALPFGVIIDTAVCLAAPETLWLSGIGDLIAKVTAVRDWKLALHATGEPVNDFAALLSDATVHQFISRPVRDELGVRLLGTALMLNGIAMEICGSSRPASGSEHLVSHALDSLAMRPRLHGLQVGVATYLVSRLQGGVSSDTIHRLLGDCGFWEVIRRDPLPRDEWLEAFRRAPVVKSGFYTILSSRDCFAEVAALIDHDQALHGCFC